MTFAVEKESFTDDVSGRHSYPWIVRNFDANSPCLLRDTSFYSMRSCEETFKFGLTVKEKQNARF